MLRKILMTSVAAIAMVGSAYAADLPSRKAPPVAYVPPVPIFTWTGFYIGVNGGGMFRANNNNGYNNAIFFGGARPVANFNGKTNNERFLVGGQAGVNWQVSSIVFGIEGDGQALLGGRRNDFPGASGGSSNGFLGTVRGRLGVAFDRFLVYGTGGVAFGNTGYPTVAVAAVPGRVRGVPGVINIPGYFTADNNNSSRVGYALGGGVEYAFLDNWSLKVEYLFTDLGRTNRTYYLGGGLPAGFTVTGREQNHVVRAGLNYRFNWGGAVGGPVVARY